MGGEEFMNKQTYKSMLGLPPRGRGRANYIFQENGNQRITPAWAGKRNGRFYRALKVSDYPRVGGEELTSHNRLSITVGLPPRGRGRATLGLNQLFPYRITPAWAGKSCLCVRFFGSSWDYPRVGGEEMSEKCMNVLVSGLPPRGRGRDGDAWRLPDGRGITPAWAGKRPHGDLRGSGGQDYPRVGGEERDYVKLFSREPGLPPRGRGRETPVLVFFVSGRITPAWAGKSEIV